MLAQDINIYGKKEIECEAKLSFVNTTLFHSLNLLKIRKYLREQQDFVAIDSLVDYALLHDLSIYTSKGNFSQQYKDKTTLGLYKKNIKLVMQEFCIYPPKYINNYKESLKVIESDCINEQCVKCSIL